MFRLSAARAFCASRALLAAPPAGTSPGARKTFFNASADDDGDDGFDSAVSAAGGGARPADATLSDQQRRDREREERRRLRLLSKDFGVEATKIFDRLTTALDTLEDVDRRTAISTSALTQRLAFDEMTHTSLSSLLQEILASTAVAYDPLDAARPHRGGGAPVASRADDDRMDALALKRSLSAAERESFFRYTRRQSRIREGERTALAHAKARNLTHLLQREKEHEKRQRQRKQAEEAAARTRRAERGSEWEDAAENGVSL